MAASDVVLEVPDDEEEDEVTVTETELEVLVAYVELPPYVAVSVYVPALLKDVVSVAVPELSVPVPSEVLPL